MSIRLTWMICLSVSIFFSNVTSLFAIKKSIYGNDDRVESRDFYSEVYKQLSKSTAAMIHDYFLPEVYDQENDTLNYFIDSTYKLNDQSKTNVCTNEKFSEQIIAAECSGFLVGPNTLITASHCVETQFHCDNYKWVFNFEEGVNKLSQDEVYGCAGIVNRVVDEKNYDYEMVVIELDREVVGREPLVLESKDNLSEKDEIVIIGHPSGLPKKIADQGKVVNNESQYHSIVEIDAFTGNSGSPVFNLKTGKVVGMLTEGGQDYYYDESFGCQRPVVCQSGECEGEKMVKSKFLFENLII